jgi:hypothetical protein
MWRNLFLFPARKMIFLFPREKARGNQTKRFVFSDFIRKFAGFFAGRSRGAAVTNKLIALWQNI